VERDFTSMPTSNKLPLQRQSKALTQMRTWSSCHRSLLASGVHYAGSINMTNAVDSLNVENIVEGSRCATALASHADILEPLVLRFEECGGSLPPGGSLWPKEYQGGSGSRSEIDPSRSFLQDPTYARSLASSRSTELRICPRDPLSGPYSGALGSPQRSWGLVSASPDTYRGVL
jgi:hypothetical protein